MIIAKYHHFNNEQTNRILLVDSLSDGEQAFLERMALIYLLSDNECLFLLDEPESGVSTKLRMPMDGAILMVSHEVGDLTRAQSL